MDEPQGYVKEIVVYCKKVPKTSHNHITALKYYKATLKYVSYKHKAVYYLIKADNGAEITIRPDCCAWLDDGEWYVY